MTSVSLSANSRGRSLYLHTVKSSIGLMVAIFLLLFLSGPLPFIIQSLNMLTIRRMNGTAEIYSSSMYGNVYSSGSFALFLLVAIVGGLVVGLIVSSYMHNRQAMDVFGALPVKRESLLFSKVMGGLTILFIPYILNVIILFSAQGILQAYENTYGIWAVDLASFFVYAAAVFSITIFCAVNTGTVFDTAVFSMTLCGAPSIAILLNRTLLSHALIGYSSTESIDKLIVFLSPVVAPFFRLLQVWDNIDVGYVVKSLVVWPIAVALIVVFSLLVYRNRDNEISGTPRSSGAVQLITKLLAADIVGILVALLFSETLVNNWISTAAGFLLGAFVAYFITEAILARGFKTFTRMLLQFACISVVILVYTGILYTGGFGYSKRVPDANNVEKVSISYGGMGDGAYAKYLPYYYYEDRYDSAYSEPEVITQVVKAHKAITKAKGFAQINDGDYNAASLAQKGLIGSSMTVEYTLKNGKTIKRVFSKTPVEAREHLYALDGIKAFRVKNDLSAYLKAEDIVSVSRTDMTLPLSETSAATSLTKAQAQRLLDAMQEDAANATQNQLLSPGERELFTLNINLLYNNPPGNVINSRYDYPSQMEDIVSQPVYSWDQSTISFLNELGWHISAIPDVSGIRGAYLLRYASSSPWIITTAYANEELGGVVDTTDYTISLQEIYFETRYAMDEDSGMYYKEYAYETGESVLNDDMLTYLAGHRIIDPAKIVQLVEASTSRYNASAGEKFYVVAFENAYAEEIAGGLAQTVSVYIIPESRAPEFLQSMQPMM